MYPTFNFQHVYKTQMADDIQSVMFIIKFHVISLKHYKVYMENPHTLSYAAISHTVMHY